MTAALATPDAPPVTFSGTRMAVRFDRFGPAAYAVFLRLKALPESTTEFDAEDESYTVSAPARFAALLGADRPAARAGLPMPRAMYPDQRLLVRQALDAERFALWCLCGYGKTVCGLEFVRQATHLGGGRGLIVTLADLVPEWLAEAARFYRGRARLRVVRLRSREAVREWCEHGTVGHVLTEAAVAITNYEKFNPDEAGQDVAECRHLVCVVLDEAGRLRASGGKQKWALVKSMKGVRYKLLLTATPAPNELMEFASQASFLEKMRAENEIIWTFFTRDPQTQKWTVKPHARAAFFAWMATWSIYVNDPKRYGWRLDRPDVPRPTYHVREVPATPEQLDLARTLAADRSTGQMGLFAASAVDMVQRNKLSQVAKGFIYEDTKPTPVPSLKPAVVAETVRAEVARGVQVLVWTVFDAESDILAGLLADLDGVAVLTGSVRPADRPAVLARYKTGAARVLISRASMLGYGMNLQMTGSMVFSGWTDSFEAFYQAVRRAVRAGQTDTVRVHLPLVRELEGDTFDNVQRKEREFEASIAEMEASYIAARGRLQGVV